MALDASAPPPTELQTPEPRWAEQYEPRPVARQFGAGLWLALEMFRTVRTLVSLGVLLLLVLVVVNFTSTAGQLSQRLNSAWQRTEQGFVAAGQAVADAFNPTRPPRYPVSQDTEFGSFFAVRVGETVGDSPVYKFTLGGIKRRDDAGGNPDVAQYALLNRQYKVPRETKILGVTVRVDRGEQQFVLDRGETFRIGGKLYKVNWISAADQQMAAGVYRNPDQFAGKLAFDSD